jgi:hypothetical protein
MSKLRRTPNFVEGRAFDLNTFLFRAWSLAQKKGHENVFLLEKKRFPAAIQVPEIQIQKRSAAAWMGNTSCDQWQSQVHRFGRSVHTPMNHLRWGGAAAENSHAARDVARQI